MASKLVFSPSEDEILIQEVQANSILYDLADTNYKNILWKIVSGRKYPSRLENLVSKKFQIFSIIKNIISFYVITWTQFDNLVDDTKKRWKNIRDSYSRNKRKPGTGSAATKKKWNLAPHLSFLDRVMSERK